MKYRLMQETESPVLLEQIFYNRGFDSKDEIIKYLKAGEHDILDPNLLDNMEKGAKLLLTQIMQKNPIFIKVDSDCDGYTSSAVLINYLNKVFPSYVQNDYIKYSFHENKAHGIVSLDEIPQNVKLVIAPDSSSNEFEIHTALKNKGIDVLCLDHHHAEKVSEDACIINNQLCDYPNKTLSGVGIVYKFCQYLDSILNIDYANNFIDLVALGLIADLMDVRERETKAIIDKGLNNINNPYMKAMVELNTYVMRDGIDQTAIAFYVAPFVNAMTRAGSLVEKNVLFCAMLDHKAYEQIPSTKRGAKPGDMETYLQQACRICNNVKNRQNKSRDSFSEQAELIIAENNLLDNKILVIQFEIPVDKNLTGLIANELASKYMRPILILNKMENGDWSGSGRAPQNFEISDLRGFLEESGLVEFAQGHASAFGVLIKEENIPLVINLFNTTLKNCDLTPIYNVDFIYQNNNIIDLDILTIAEHKSLWGQGFPEPYIAIEDVKIYPKNVKLVSPDLHPTLKIEMSNDISFIKFKSSKEEYESLVANPSGALVMNIVGRCSKNTWNGMVSPQIIIEDYEVIKEIPFYF